MRAVIQRVKSSKVIVDDRIVGEIGSGLTVLLGIGKDDTSDDLDYIVRKIAALRVFEDNQGKMNLSVKDVNGEILAISQFTLYGDVRKGNRPGFTDAGDPDSAKEMYMSFSEKMRQEGIRVGEGIFQAHMVVEIINDGPVTILIDSKKNF